MGRRWLSRGRSRHQRGQLWWWLQRTVEVESSEVGERVTERCETEEKMTERVVVS